MVVTGLCFPLKDNRNSLPTVGNINVAVVKRASFVLALKSPDLNIGAAAVLTFTQRVRYSPGKALRAELLATGYVNVALWLLEQQLFEFVGGPQKKRGGFSVSSDQLSDGGHFRRVQLVAQKRLCVLHAQIRRSWKNNQG